VTVSNALVPKGPAPTGWNWALVVSVRGLESTEIGVRQLQSLELHPSGTDLIGASEARSTVCLTGLPWDCDCLSDMEAATMLSSGPGPGPGPGTPRPGTLY
jgi:hypothetical protein